MLLLDLGVFDDGGMIKLLFVGGDYVWRPCVALILVGAVFRGLLCVIEIDCGFECGFVAALCFIGAGMMS